MGGSHSVALVIYHTTLKNIRLHTGNVNNPAVRGHKERRLFYVALTRTKNHAFTGGCNGTLQGISRLIEGMKAEDAISRLKGIRCGFKNTSCPDQLAQALESMI